METLEKGPLKIGLETPSPWGTKAGQTSLAVDEDLGPSGSDSADARSKQLSLPRKSRPILTDPDKRNEMIQQFHVEMVFSPIQWPWM